MDGLAGVDLEWVNGDRLSIVQIGLGSSQLSGNDNFVSYVNPGFVPFHPKSVAVHGIDASVVQSERTFGDVWADARQWLSVNGIESLVAHNAASEAYRLTAAILASRSPTARFPIHCTLRWVRALNKKGSRAWKRLVPPGVSLGLESLAQLLGLPDPTHDALADAVAAHALAMVVMDFLEVADPCEVDGLLEVEPYWMDDRSWLAWQLLEPRCLSVGQLRLAEADHQRALEGRLPKWLTEQSWGPHPPLAPDVLDRVVTQPQGFGLRSVPRPQISGGKASKDPILLGLIAPSSEGTQLHDLLVGDVLLALQAAGHHARGEASLLDDSGAGADLMTRAASVDRSQPWWPVELDRNVAASSKRGRRTRAYFDRTRGAADSPAVWDLAFPHQRLSWVGFASLVKCNRSADQSRPPRQFVNAANSGPRWDLVHVVHGFVEGDLIDLAAKDRRRVIQELFDGHRQAAVLPVSVDSSVRYGSRDLPLTIAWSVEQARIRRAVVLPFVRDLVAVAALVRPVGAVFDLPAVDLSWDGFRIEQVVRAAGRLDSRIASGKRDPGEKTETGGAIKTDHATVLLTGVIGEQLGPTVKVGGAGFVRHALELTVPNWSGLRVEALIVRIPVVLRDGPLRCEGQRVWCRGVVIGTDGDLMDVVFGSQMLSGLVAMESVAVVVGWMGAIPSVV
jgi:DNA polymerase III epsilon subunit-like protein